MPQLYGMDALNRAHKLYKKSKMNTGLTRSVSLENLFKEFGWETLSKRRQQHKLSFMYKVNNGIVPSYIQDLIPPLVSQCPSIELVSHKIHVFPLPLDYGTLFFFFFFFSGRYFNIVWQFDLKDAKTRDMVLDINVHIRIVFSFLFSVT